MKPTCRLLAVSLAVAVLPACVTHPQRPAREVHHYSHDAEGTRLACYRTEVAREYDCYPLDGHQAVHDHAHFDPWWPLFGLGLVYSWHHHPHHGHHYWRPRGTRHGHRHR